MKDVEFSQDAKRFFGPLAVVFTGIAIFVIWLAGFGLVITGWTSFCLWTLLVLLGVAALGFWITGDGNIRAGMRSMFT